MAATSDEEMESLLRNFEYIYQAHREGFTKIRMLRLSYDAEIKRRESLELSCNSLKTDNERLTKLNTNSLANLANQLECRSKFLHLEEELIKVQDERLTKEAEHRKEIEMLKQDHEVKIADLEEQSRYYLLQKQAIEVTINQLQQDLASCKMQIDVLTHSLKQVRVDAALKLMICKTKQAEQQQEPASNRHVETLKQKIMKLRKENEVLKRQLLIPHAEDV